MIRIQHLGNGGIMANYKCSAACRHCLYACSPSRTGGYMTPETMREVLPLMRLAGCYSAHIGGGEPFLHFEGLLTLTNEMRRAGIAVDYIETNASWFNAGAAAQLDALAADHHTLCISIDPFHAEYIPTQKPLALAAACDDAGVQYFLWQQQFLPQLRHAGVNDKQSRAQLESALGHDYIIHTAEHYGITMGGRAVNIGHEFYHKKDIASLLDGKPCSRVTSTDHYHIDMYGRFIPPGCTGIAVPLTDALDGTSGRYIVWESLSRGGVRALYDLATAEGYTAQAGGYTSKCDFCFDMRCWLAQTGDYPELDAEHYQESLKHY